MREFLEFHDSELVAVERTGEGVRLELVGYIHRWIAGEGTGWNFRTDLRLNGGTGTIASPLPIGIADGTVSVDGADIPNMVELPFAHTGACRVMVQTVDGETYVLTGNEIRIARGPDGTFIETLPAEFNPDAAG